MEFETLKKNNKKKWIIGSIVIIGILSTITYIGTRAKYRMTSNAQLASGEINYSPSDLEVVSVKLQNDSNEYDNSDNIPTSGYQLNSTLSVCKVGDEKQDVEITYENGKVAINGITIKGTKCEIYFDKERYLNEVLLAKANDNSITSYETGNKSEMFLFSHYATGQTKALTDYRYIGSNPNNYVNFNNEIWRIIGIFEVENESGVYEQRIKLIRNESIGVLSWNTKRINEWSNSSLYKELNISYYSRTGNYVNTGLLTDTRKMISSAKWYLGGNETSNLAGPSFYNFERGSTVANGSINIIQNVGIMYPSDYIYTYANEVDNKCYSSGYNCSKSKANPSSGWLYKGVSEWTLSPDSSNSGNAFYIGADGSVFNIYTYNYSASSMLNIRPVVYLKSDIKILDNGKDGSFSRPYDLF